MVEKKISTKTKETIDKKTKVISNCPARADEQLANECDHPGVWIDYAETVQILNHLDKAASEPQCCPPFAMGACVPVALGRKPKKSLEQKLSPLIGSVGVPSVLAACFFQQTRRFLGGQNAANEMEQAAYDVFAKLSSDLRQILACSLRVYDSLSPEVRDKLFAPEIFSHNDQPVAPQILSELVVTELLQRLGMEVYDDTDGAQHERPGRVRVTGGDEIRAIPVRIDRINGLRTKTFVPHLTIGEYEPSELQQLCELEVIDGEASQNCRVQTEDCPGNDVDGTCLRVQDFRSGDAVILQGVNFFNVQAVVRLTAQPPGSFSREIEAHVFGDQETPVTETDGEFVTTILDSRVQDLISFRLPEDLPPAVYTVTVVVPNNSGLQEFESIDQFLSTSPEFIRVLPPDTATFQISGETLECVKETAAPIFRNLGSDEVALRVISIPILPDLTPEDMDIENNFRFGNVDSGNTRELNRLIFQRDNTGGVAIVIAGFEVDDEDVFEKQITDFSDAYVEVLQSNWATLTAGVGATGGAVALALGLSSAWATAIALSISTAINVFVALWAPADLIIEDSIGLTAFDLAMLTSPNFPMRPEVSFTSAGAIDVNIVPVSKSTQYLERREYTSEEEDSEYHIFLRFNRLA